MIYLAMAFIAVWVLVTGYVFFLSRRQNNLELEMSTLEEIVAEGSSVVSD